MAGGFYAGIGWGAVVSVVVAGSVSLFSDLPGAQSPESAALEVPAGSQFDTTRRDTAATLPTSDASADGSASTQETAGVSRVIAPEPDDLSPMQGADTASATQPDTGNAESALGAPQSGDAPQVDAVTDTPIAATAQNAGSALPQVISGEDTLSISTDPAQPMSPQVPQIGSTDSGFSVADTSEVAPEMPAAQIVPTDGNGGIEAQPQQPQQPLMEALDVDTASISAPAPAPAVPSEPSNSAEQMSQTDVTDSRVAGVTQEGVSQAPVVASVAPVQPMAQSPVQSEMQVATQTAPQPDGQSGDEAPAVATLPQANPQTEPQIKPEAQIEIAAVSKPFQNLAPNVATNRLPSLGSPTPVAVSETAQAEYSDADRAELPPIERYAVAFENPDKKPLMSIVLIDDGSSPIGFEALAAFPYPVSFAVDTAWDGAAGAMADYRAAGFEVLALVDLASEATGQDAEVNMAIKLRAVPEAVAVMEGPDSGFQGNRAVSDQVTMIAQAGGLGLVLFPKGLNTAQKLAVKAGVPAAAVFRDFDAKGQNAKAIRRFLDHAAFKAGQQDDGVIMVGRLRADTISALLLWGLQDRANRVALAPVSAVLVRK